MIKYILSGFNLINKFKESLILRSINLYGKSKKMDTEVNVVEFNGKKIIEGIEGKVLIANEDDALTFLGHCVLHDTDLILLYSSNLSPAFFDLKTKLAGYILQKYTNYQLKLALIMPDDQVKGKFRQMVREANRGNSFHVYSNIEDAKKWLAPPEK